MSFEEMVEISEEALRRNEHRRGEAGYFTVRQFLTRGLGGSPRKAGPPIVGVIVKPIEFSHFAHLYEIGCHGVITRTRSYPAESLDPKLKHYSRLNFNLADLEGWPILMDLDG